MATLGYTSTYRATARGANAVIWTIGDSITRGAVPRGGAFIYEGGWRRFPYQRLVALGRTPTMVGGLLNSADGLATSVAGTSHNGNNGSSAAQWVSSIYATYQPGLGATPTIITIALGANDSDTVGSGQSVGAVIDLAIASYPLANVLVATRTPTAAGSSSTINGQIAAEVTARIRAGKHVQLVDQFAAVATVDLPDGLHPASPVYKKLGDLWTNAIVPLAA